MEERRRSQRLPLELHATAFSEDYPEGWHIVITEISQEGVAIRFHSPAAMQSGQRLRIEVDTPARIEPVRAEISIRHADAHAGSTTGCGLGGELLAILPEDKNLLLAYGYENWRRHQEQADPRSHIPA